MFHRSSTEEIYIGNLRQLAKCWEILISNQSAKSASSAEEIEINHQSSHEVIEKSEKMKISNRNHTVHQASRRSSSGDSNENVLHRPHILSSSKEIEKSINRKRKIEMKIHAHPAWKSENKSNQSSIITHHHHTSENRRNRYSSSIHGYR